MKVLVIRFSSIGDIVLTTPVVRALKLQCNAEVHYLTKRAFEGILSPNPYIDKVFSFSSGLEEVMPLLLAENYDRVVDLHHNLRSMRIKLRLGKPATSFPKLNFEKWMLVNLGIHLLPDKHIVDRYLATVAHLGVKNDGLGLDYFIPAEETVDIQAISPNLAPGKYLAFVLGATHATKRLPEHKMLEICLGATCPVVLLGGKQEGPVGNRLCQQGGKQIINLCGSLSLHQSASVIRQAREVLTHDTGLMHIAAAFRKKIISVWGNTVPAFGMYPYYPEGINLNASVEVEGLKCRPCSKIGYDKCPKGHFRCMEDIAVEKILELLDA